MLPSQIGTAIDKLVALFTTALPVDFHVADGPQTQFPTMEWAAVGSDGAVNEEEDAGRSSQIWKGLGAMIRDESIDIVCAIGTSTGATEQTMQPLRTRVLELLAMVEAGLRANPGLDGFTTGGAAAVTELALRYPTNAQGLAAVVVFTINIPVRI